MAGRREPTRIARADRAIRASAKQMRQVQKKKTLKNMGTYISINNLDSQEQCPSQRRTDVLHCRHILLNMRCIERGGCRHATEHCAHLWYEACFSPCHLTSPPERPSQEGRLEFQGRLCSAYMNAAISSWCQAS